MSLDYSDEELRQGYYLQFASALCRARHPDLVESSLEDQVRQGLKRGLKLYHFKRSANLPRVKKVLGILQGLAPESLMDIGSGRGVFLWPALDTFPWLPVLAIDYQSRHTDDYQDIYRGGIEQLCGLQMDVTRLALCDDAVDVVTFLEVMEHLPDPRAGLAEAVRVASRFVVLSVPSKEDDNPEHIHLFNREKLSALFQSVGVNRVSFDAVLNHTIAVARVSS